MSPKIITRSRPFCPLLFLILQTLAIAAALSIPLTNPISLLLLNSSTATPTAAASPPPLTDPTSQNATSPAAALLPQNMFDYHVAGTRLILRITETGLPFTERAVNTIIDAAIRKVVAKINAGFGGASIEGGKFNLESKDIDMRITALQDVGFTYFLLGTLFLAVGGFFFFFFFLDIQSCESHDSSVSLFAETVSYLEPQIP